MCRNTLKHENGLKPQVLMSFGVVRIKDPRLGFAPAKATAMGVAISYRGLWCVAIVNGALAFATLGERVVCVVYVVFT
ncbi:hypothetical protein Taro_036707 [Colocasia esculenta]|uniref:Uncharacterized protein n=1 Tax=Colocasia esculenta TaxID=4460 RepID=A0A843W3T2_COLES|nr:hypothetical protein [Colocasia esculenta]